MGNKKQKELYQMDFEEVLQTNGIAIFRLSVGNAKKLMRLGKQYDKWTSSAQGSGLGAKTYDVKVEFKDVTFFEEKLGKKRHKAETKLENEGPSSYSVKSMHKQAIQNAIKEGKTVPNEVLKLYPELKLEPLTYENSTFKKTLDTAVKNGFLTEAKKKVVSPKKNLATQITELQDSILNKPLPKTKTKMAKSKKTPKKAATKTKRVAKPKTPKQTKAQIKAKMSAAGKKNYKGSKLEKINKLATELQQMSGTKEITVPKLSRKEATIRAARKIKLGL